MLAQHGFDAYGLEISETAVNEAEAYASAEMANPSGYHFGGGQQRPEPTGSVTFWKGDFFSSKWGSREDVDGEAKFDVVYDYTVSCTVSLLHVRRC